MSTLTPWSPSHVNKWLECPRKWEFIRTGEPEQRERWSPGLVVGVALHAGLAAALGPSEDDPAGAADVALVAAWPQDTNTGDWELAVVNGRMQKALARVLAARDELLGDNGVVRGVEVKLGEGDRESGQYPGTADLVTEHGPADDRYLVVTDYKSHWTLDDLYVEREQAETQHNWQLHQYAWFAQELYGLPVRYLRKCLIRVTPSPKVWVYAWPVEQARLQAWYKDAKRVWEQMDDAVVCGATPNWTSCRKYGRCGFFHKCHMED